MHTAIITYQPRLRGKHVIFRFLSFANPLSVCVCASDPQSLKVGEIIKIIKIIIIISSNELVCLAGRPVAHLGLTYAWKASCNCLEKRNIFVF
jgi:hypothetical protein